MIFYLFFMLASTHTHAHTFAHDVLSFDFRKMFSQFWVLAKKCALISSHTIYSMFVYFILAYSALFTSLDYLPLMALCIFTTRWGNCLPNIDLYHVHAHAHSNVLIEHVRKMHKLNRYRMR